MVHTLAIAGDWKRHAPYHYEPVFFDLLSQKNHYECLLNDIRAVTCRGAKNQRLVCSIFKKTSNASFISEDEFKNLNGLVKK